MLRNMNAICTSKDRVVIQVILFLTSRKLFFIVISMLACMLLMQKTKK